MIIDATPRPFRDECCNRLTSTDSEPSRDAPSGPAVTLSIEGAPHDLPLAELTLLKVRGCSSLVEPLPAAERRVLLALRGRLA